MNIVITDYTYDIAITKEEIRRAVDFYGNAMMDKNHVKKLKIVVSFDDDYFPSKNPRLHMAFCTALLEPRKKNPTDFVIELNRRLTRGGIVKALAHEMVHVKQYSTGEMTFRDKYTVFRGTSYDPEKMDYYEWPWEIEAFGYEIGLVHKYRLFCKEKGFNVRPNKKRRKAVARSNGCDDRVAPASRLHPVHEV